MKIKRIVTSNDLWFAVGQTSDCLYIKQIISAIEQHTLSNEFINDTRPFYKIFGDLDANNEPILLAELFWDRGMLIEYEN